MIVTHLQLSDFRNYAEAELELHPGPNLLVGRNGQGKTNLVEAIGYLATLGSHRVSSDQALVRQGMDAAIVRAQLASGDRRLLVELQLNRLGANRAQVNRAPAKPRDLPRHVSSVLFAPEDLALVRGEPSGRRRFLDQLLVQRAPRFAGVIGDYERVLRQRNTLLKTARAAARHGDLSTLEVWDERLIALGAELVVARLELVAELEPFAADAYRAIAGEEHVAQLAMRLSVLGEQPDDEPVSEGDAVHGRRDVVETAAAFRDSLARVRRQELDRGLTLVGPHRDDLELQLNGLPARGYASHGESWSFALSLKLAAAGILRRDSPTGDPVLVLDDVFAELDATRRLRLADAVKDYEQVLITAAVFEDVPQELAGHVVRIRAGRILEEGEA
ncbi:DNA replication/repair protein RecF [Homoserinibacter sp. YIM 151385]|uniref:DNA replication/repair protein RecF n=1 Tax=Homoserinibacter sp. YIM 151385 TaxID=2985506 RepID=UPI0022F0B4EA|nr:DNA replication/repair protein RecF [Homoserinibacter sp. YIM 151385]WBU37238.1 DNA replication/repair protein RecF [Homoserinibacter sp. YIM 151385]